MVTVQGAAAAVQHLRLVDATQIATAVAARWHVDFERQREVLKVLQRPQIARANPRLPVISATAHSTPIVQFLRTAVSPCRLSQ